MLRAESCKMLEAQEQAQAAAARAAPVVTPARSAAGERQMIERALTTAAPNQRPVIERPAVEATALDFVVAPPIDSNAYLNASTLAAHGLTPEELVARCGLPAGEARLLASLASARGRREQAADAAASSAGEPAARAASGSGRS
jgi:hypothetical protein